MERLEFSPRENWENLIAAQGLVYDLNSPEDTKHYWNETAAYVFTEDEVDNLAADVEELHSMCLEATRYLASGEMGLLGFSEKGFNFAKESLEDNQPDFYGRFDLAYQGDGSPAKLYEYNADTPTGIIEGAVCQWYWKEDRFPFNVKYNEYDQWNNIFKAFKNRWKELLDLSENKDIHFANVSYDSSGEDWLNTALLKDTAEQAGWDTVGITMDDIGWDHDNKLWVGRFNEPIHNIFKLYPWENMVDEEFGDLLMNNYKTVEHWFEPPWKMFISNKILLVALWRIYPNHKNLLPTYLGDPNGMKEWVSKPIFGREGTGIEVSSDKIKTKSLFEYYKQGLNNETIYQKWEPLPDFKDSKGKSNHPVLGCWVVNGESAGCGIRESDDYITDYYCRFVPNLIKLDN